jgi:hypothetical protein
MKEETTNTTIYVNLNEQVREISSVSLNEEKKIYEIHCKTIWAHAGVSGTWIAYWKNIGQRVPRRLVSQVIAHCDQCQQYKSSWLIVIRDSRGQAYMSRCQ